VHGFRGRVFHVDLSTGQSAYRGLDAARRCRRPIMYVLRCARLPRGTQGRAGEGTGGRSAACSVVSARSDQMTASWPAFAARKTREASDARIDRFRTVLDRSFAFDLRPLAEPWIVDRFDGPFWYRAPDSTPPPSINLVMVQSRDGNTGADDPSVLGGGDADKHFIYEGVSRVAADAVMTGAHTARGVGILSVWHPAFVELRAASGKPRHPAQVVVTSTGTVPVDELMFCVPEIQVLIITTARGAERIAPWANARSWIRVIDAGDPIDLRAAVIRLRREFGVEVISAIGGRTLATGLIDARLIADFYLTTGAASGGEPSTPYYTGLGFERALCQRKIIGPPAAEVIFEHFVLNAA
jgi:riboflavin biosynthesis pyrimidine reductase